MTVRGCAFDAPLPFEQRGEAFFAYGSSADTGHKRTLLFQLMVFFFSMRRLASRRDGQATARRKRNYKSARAVKRWPKHRQNTRSTGASRSRQVGRGRSLAAVKHGTNQRRIDKERTAATAPSAAQVSGEHGFQGHAQQRPTDGGTHTHTHADHATVHQR